MNEGSTTIRNRKGLWLIAAVVLATAGSLLWWQSTTPEPQMKLLRVRIGYQPIAANVPFFVAMEKGLFRAHGLEVEPVRFETADAAADALLRGDIATDFSLPMLVLLSREAALPGTFLAFGFQLDTPEHSHEALVVPTESEINQLGDLKGKSIGVFPGVAAKTYLVEALAKAGVPGSEVNVKPLQVQLHLQSLRAKHIDALLGFEPAVTIAVAEGFGRVVEWGVYPRRLQNPFPVTAFAMTRAYTSRHKTESEAIVGALSDAVAFISKSPTEANRTVTKYTSLEDQRVAEKLNQPLNVLAGDIDRANLQRFVDWHQEIGLIPVIVKMDAVLFFGHPQDAKK